MREYLHAFFRQEWRSREDKDVEVLGVNMYSARKEQVF